MIQIDTTALLEDEGLEAPDLVEHGGFSHLVGVCVYQAGAVCTLCGGTLWPGYELHDGCGLQRVCGPCLLLAGDDWQTPAVRVEQAIARAYGRKVTCRDRMMAHLMLRHDSEEAQEERRQVMTPYERKAARARLAVNPHRRRKALGQALDCDIRRFVGTAENGRTIVDYPIEDIRRALRKAA